MCILEKTINYQQKSFKKKLSPYLPILYIIYLYLPLPLPYITFKNIVFSWDTPNIPVGVQYGVENHSTFSWKWHFNTWLPTYMNNVVYGHKEKDKYRLVCTGKYDFETQMIAFRTLHLHLNYF